MTQATHVLVRRNSIARKRRPVDHTKARSTALSKDESSRKCQADVSFMTRKDTMQNNANPRK